MKSICCQHTLLNMEQTLCCFIDTSVVTLTTIRCINLFGQLQYDLLDLQQPQLHSHT